MKNMLLSATNKILFLFIGQSFDSRQSFSSAEYKLSNVQKLDFPI